MEFRRGFTLLELVVAILIFVLVVGTIYFTLIAGFESFRRGEESMQIYQSVRIGLERVGKDVRRAVSPESPWSNLAEAAYRDAIDGGAPSDIDLEHKLENDIIFKGTKKQMTFVVQDEIPGGDPAFDLREIKYYVDPKKKILVREAVKSLMKKRMQDWKALRFKGEEKSRRRYGTEINFRDLKDKVADNIESMELHYFDGTKWRDKWDSNQIVREDRYYEELVDEGIEPEREGLPDAVRIRLELTNHDFVELDTEVPATEIARLYQENEELIPPRKRNNPQRRRPRRRPSGPTDSETPYR